jgi:O-antigen ligase
MRPMPGLAAVVLILIAWGALSFGAVYPWAYWPLAGGAALVGIFGLLWHREIDAMPVPGSVLAALAATFVAMLVQLLPLGRDTVAAVSPNATRVVESYNRLLETTAQTGRTLSIQPRATLITAGLYAALVFFLLGTLRGLSFGATTRIASAMVALGFLIAVVGIVQKPIYTGRIYGFWTPVDRGSNPFGPFVNRNHYAGWMAMTLSLSLGYLCGRAAEIVPRARPGLRNRLLWFSSRDASQIVLVGFAIVVMAIAMVMTLSIAGLLCLVVAVFVTGWTVLSRHSGSRRLLLGGYLAFVVVVAIGWSSMDLLATRFTFTNWSPVNGRLGAWKDAWGIARRFMVFGSGMNSYGITTIFYQTFDRAVHYEQAHNDYLQILAEGGLLVAVPAAVAVLLVVRQIGRRFAEGQPGTMRYWIRIGAVTGLIAIALQETVDFSLQMPGNALLFAVLTAIALHRPIRYSSPQNSVPR